MGEVICPYCKAALQERAIIRCLQCGTRHHQICWLEYGNHCSVFSCEGKQIATHSKAGSSLLLIAWCLMNYALHLALRLVGYLTGPIPLEDVFIVAILEAVVILTGWMVIKTRSTSEPARTVGIVLFSGNALFVSFLFSHFAVRGYESLNALIRL